MISILDLIPHRDPFLFLNSLEDFQDDGSVSGYWNPLGRDDLGQVFLRWPLVLEALAQLSSCLVSYKLGASAKNKTFVFAKIHEAESFSDIPYAPLKLFAKIERFSDRIVRFFCEAHSESGTLMCRSIFSGMSVETDQLSAPRSQSLHHGIRLDSFKADRFCYIHPHSDFFRGHFPHFPIVPGVLLLEGLFNCLPNVRITKVEDVSFRAPVYPGDLVAFNIQKQEHFFEGQASVENKSVIQARLKSS